MFCEECGAKISQGEKFCGECGAPIRQGNTYSQKSGIFCEKCGAKVANGEKFCGECGSIIQQNTGKSFVSNSFSFSRNHQLNSNERTINIFLLVCSILGGLTFFMPILANASLCEFISHLGELSKLGSYNSVTNVRNFFIFSSVILLSEAAGQITSSIILLSPDFLTKHHRTKASQYLTMLILAIFSLISCLIFFMVLKSFPSEFGIKIDLTSYFKLGFGYWFYIVINIVILIISINARNRNKEN